MAERDPSKDLSKLVEQSVTTLQEVDKRLQAVRSDLANLITRASTLQGTAVPPGVAHPAFANPGYGSPAFGQGPGFMNPAFAPPGLVNPAFGLARPPFSPFPGAPGLPGVQGSPGGSSAQPNGDPSGGLGTGREFQHIQPVPRVPTLDLVDAGEEYLVQVDLPGVKKEDLDLTITERSVILQATSRPHVGNDALVLLSERPPVVYSRVIPLPAEVATAKSKASFKDGILTLTVPKKVPGEGPRKLDVAFS